MIPELGFISLLLAMMSAFLLAVVPQLGLWLRKPALTQLAWGLSYCFGLFTLAAISILAYSFAVDDFTLEYVAAHSNSQLPTFFKIAATWGGHEGSMLFWLFSLSVWVVLFALFNRKNDRTFVAQSLVILGLICFSFAVFIIFFSNPYGRIFPAPLEGRDLNPMLQDVGLIFHPPLLYLGYVGFAVNFALSITALLHQHLESQIARVMRVWVLVSWLFLTLGIVLGAWWAYYELGWGGWWFWDPVENASFMPWLVGTALMHSLIVTELRGTFRNWTLLLAIAAFSLSLVGTFIVRSGVITSVHAFATDPARGVFILSFLVVVIGGSLFLYAWRAPRLAQGNAPATFSFSSRESMLLANNLLLVVACAAVFLGTMYPLLLDTLELGKISVGPPYFEAVFVPLMAPAVFLMGVGPVARWRNAPVPDLLRRLRWALGVSIVTTVLVALTSGRFSAERMASPAEGGVGVGGAVLFAIGMFIGIWAIASALALLRERLWPSGEAAASRSAMERARALPAAFWGMLVAHIGVGVFIIGVAGVNTLETEADEALAPGQSMSLGGYEFRLQELREVPGPNYQAVQAKVEVSRDGRFHSMLLPEKRAYSGAMGSTQTEAAIETRLTGDVYVALGERLPDGRWTMLVWIKPFVDWIWGGCVLMALGGFIAMADRRYRRRRSHGRRD